MLQDLILAVVSHNQPEFSHLSYVTMLNIQLSSPSVISFSHSYNSLLVVTKLHVPKQNYSIFNILWFIRFGFQLPPVVATNPLRS